MPDIVLLEFADDAAEAIRCARRDNAALVALTPEAMQALDDSGARYEIWTDREQQAREDRLARENLLRVAPIAEAVRARTRTLLPDADAQGFDLVRCWGQQVIILLDAVSFRAAGLERLSSACSASRITYFDQPDGKPGDFIWRAGESVWSAVCGAARRRAFLGLEWVPLASRAEPARVRRRIDRAARPGVSGLARITARAMKRAAGAIVPPDRTASVEAAGGERIIGFGRGQELDRALAHVRGYAVMRWDVPPASDAIVMDADACRRAAADALSDIASKGLTSWNAFDGGEAIRSRWLHWFESLLPRTAGAFTAARSALRRIAPAMLIHSETGPDAARRTVLEAAGTLRIPRVLLQWGGNYGYMRQPYLAFAELRSDWMLTYTDAVAAALAESATLAAEPLPSARAIGSFYFAETAERWRRSVAPRDIVYVPSGTTGPYRYGPHLCLDDAALFQLERTVVAALAARFPGRVVIKRHPSNRLACDPIETWLRSSGLDARATTGPLEEVVPRAAVWVIDSLATALQQVAFTKRPIVYLDTGAIAPLEPGEAMLKRATVWLDTWAADLPERLVAAVEDALVRASNPGADVFLTAWVGRNGPAMVADRLNEALRTISCDGLLVSGGLTVTE